MKDRELFERLLKEVELPDFSLMEMRQEQPQLTDIKAALTVGLQHCAAMQKVKKDDTVAIAMGSREINGLADIAETLMISRAALYRHIASLNEKTGTKSRIGLVQFYYRYHRRNEG